MDAVKQKFILFAEKHSGVKTVSSFYETGKLTPEEFVMAGDFLVDNFRTWTWGAGDEKNRRDHLPPDKQFIQTKNVPCVPLPKDTLEPLEKEIEGDEGWVEAFQVSKKAPDELADDIQDLAVSKAEPEDEAEPDLDDIPDMDDVSAEGAILRDDDPSVAEVSKDSHLQRFRTYDITITYDKYYSVPRVWLFGYSAEHVPLKESEWRSDFSADHVDKTVTYETHPHLGYSCPSIHPCKHAEAMQKMVRMFGESGESLHVRYYLMIFLKFIQSIIPNIEYDYTGQFVIRSDEDAS